MKRTCGLAALSFLLLSNAAMAVAPPGFQPTFSSTTWPTSNTWGTTNNSRAGDFDGDGQTDVITAGSNLLVRYGGGSNRLSAAFGVYVYSGGTQLTGAGYLNPGGYTWAGDF